MPPIASTDANHCPLCAQPNHCAMELEKSSGQAQPPCWCTTVTFDAALLAQIPDAARHTACICQGCATRTASPQTALMP